VPLPRGPSLADISAALQSRVDGQHARDPARTAAWERVCRNGTCDPGETQSTCCNDCGCPTGSLCQGSACESVGTSTFAWTFDDECDDGQPIDFRVFDKTDHLVWPAAPTEYVIQPGTTNEASLTLQRRPRRDPPNGAVVIHPAA
jgi:hypothetical protein